MTDVFEKIIKQQYVYIARIFKNDNALERHQPVLIIQNDTLNTHIDTFVAIPLLRRPHEAISVYEVAVDEPFLNGGYMATPFLPTILHKKQLISEIGKVNPTTFQSIQAIFVQITR